LTFASIRLEGVRSSGSRDRNLHPRLVSTAAALSDKERVGLHRDPVEKERGIIATMGFNPGLPIRLVSVEGVGEERFLRNCQVSDCKRCMWLVELFVSVLQVPI
jgi:hypothetical protein